MDGRAEIVIAGGGVAALEAALALRAFAEDLVNVEVVAPDSEFTYTPLAVAEPFRVGEARRFPLAPLVESAGATLRCDALAAVDSNCARLRSGATVPYHALVLALGARPERAIPGAVAFRGVGDAPAVGAIVTAAAEGRAVRIVFAVPAGVTWPLPLYELALLARAELVDIGATSVEIVIVTPEDAPLALFGRPVSDAVAELLEIRGITVHTGTTPLRFDAGALHCAPGGEVPADRCVALPRLAGRAVPGIPQDAHGFVPVDEFARVAGEADMYAIGDLTTFPVKQGGIAAQQADVAAAAIAETLGAAIGAEPFRPVLRGLLLTGMVPRFLRADAGTGVSVVDTEALWWPPAKIVGRYLAPFLAEKLGLAEALPEVAVAARLA